MAWIYLKFYHFITTHTYFAFFEIELDCCTVHIIGDCWSCSLYVCHNVSMIDYADSFLHFASTYTTIKWRMLKTLNNKLKLERVKNLD